MIKKMLSVVLVALAVVGCTACGDAENGDVDIETTNAGDDLSDSIQIDINDIDSDSVYLNPNGEEFAQKFGFFDVYDKGTITQYWDTGKNIIKFEVVTEEDMKNVYGGHTFKINNKAVDIGSSYIKIGSILVSDEFIIVITSGTDINSFPFYIFDYDGNILFKTYYTSNKGMALTSPRSLTLDGNRLIMKCSRTSHGPSLIMKPIAYYGDFSAYSDYIYQDVIYDYGGKISNEELIILDKTNLDEVALLNKNEIVSATFEMEYLGNGKFSKIIMTDEYHTLGEMKYLFD